MVIPFDVFQWFAQILSRDYSSWGRHLKPNRSDFSFKIICIQKLCSMSLFSQKPSCDIFEKLGAFICQGRSAHLSYSPTAFLVHALSPTNSYTEQVKLASGTGKCTYRIKLECAPYWVVLIQASWLFLSKGSREKVLPSSLPNYISVFFL